MWSRIKSVVSLYCCVKGLSVVAGCPTMCAWLGCVSKHGGMSPSRAVYVPRLPPVECVVLELGCGVAAAVVTAVVATVVVVVEARESLVPCTRD